MTPNLREQSAVISATFADWRTVKSRKTLQLVFEVPLEQQTEVLTMLGAPMPDAQRWCAIALLNTNSPASPTHQPQQKAATPPKGMAGEPARERKPWETLPASQKAGILCADRAFQKWVSGKIGLRPDECTEEDAAYWLRTSLGIESRRELSVSPTLAAALDNVRSEFMQWAGRVPVERR